MRRLGFITVLLVLQSYQAYATCGVGGEPGYRGQKGCVSWLDLAKGVCGCPPTTACTPEQLHRGADKVAKLWCILPKLRAR